MKRKLFGAAILLLVFIFVMVSCKSTPEGETTTDPSSGTETTGTSDSVDQSMIDALNAAKALADTNRALSLEVDGPKYFPTEWNAVESRYVQANGAAIANTASAYQAATGNYNTIAADFEKIAADALPLYGEDLRNEILAARSAAIDAGILSISPERFIVAEDYAVAAEAAWEIEEYQIAFENAKNALPRYQALKNGAEAFNVRADILNHKFGSYDTTAIDAADETAFRAVSQYDEGNLAAIATAEQALSEYNTIYSALTTASDAYDARMEIDFWVGLAAETETHNAGMGIEYGDYSAYETALNAADETAYLAIDQYDSGDANAALASAQKALAAYNAILRQALTDAIAIVEDAATKARQTAVAAKAPVAARPEFDRADAVYREAQRLVNVNDNPSAAESYYQSVSLFNEASELAEYKRQQAEAAIEEAERRIAESEQTAADAEARIEGGAQ
jgi:hypothetical protein